MSIEVRGVTKTFGSFTAVNDVSLKVPDGELMALLGPSGSLSKGVQCHFPSLSSPQATPWIMPLAKAAPVPEFSPNSATGVSCGPTRRSFRSMSKPRQTTCR